MLATLIKFMKSPQRWESHSLEGDCDNLNDRAKQSIMRKNKRTLNHANTSMLSNNTEGLGLFA